MNQDQEFLKRLLAAFKIEAGEHLNEMSSGLLELEKSSAPDEQQKIIEVVFRSAHSLKGASRAVNLRDIETVCSALENVFSKWKRKELSPAPEQFDTIHYAVDIVSDLLADPEGQSATLVSEVVQQLSRVEIGESAKKSDKAVPLPNLEAKEKRVISPSKIDPPKRAEFEKPEVEEKIDALPISKLEETKPPKIDPPKRAEFEKPQVEEKIDTPSISKIEETKAPPKKQPTQAETIRISTTKLDSLMRQAEEMLAVKQTIRERNYVIGDVLSMLEIWRKEWKKIYPHLRALQQVIQKKEIQESTDLQIIKLVEFLDWNSTYLSSAENKLITLKTSSEQDQYTLGGMVDNLLEDTKKALMMPFSSLLQLFPKMVRELSRDRSKKVELVLQGSEVEIDKRVLEGIKDPLIHLVRNCVDHGLETPEERIRYDKPAKGTVKIVISQMSGSQIEILVSDDGAGINLTKVKEKAIANGILSGKDAETLTKQEIVSLILESGISTSPIITDISGRGLGMAIVREKIEKIGGSMSVETELHLGSSFRLLLPMTLATFRGILVKVADQIFVIPTANVKQAKRVEQAEIKTVENINTIPLNGRAVSLVRLDDVLELHHTQSENSDFMQIVLLSASDKQIAFRVDEILDEQEVLVKSLGKQLSRVRNVAGVTVLGSGKVVPILNVLDLIKSAIKNVTVSLDVAIASDEVEGKRKSILVVDDSITSRMLLKGILQSAKYSVKAAVDGAEAFQMLKTEDFDLLVSDVEMPRMNGFDLTAKVRNDKRLAELPVVLVTSLASREDQERGIDVGADAYIIKSNFDQTKLLNVIQRLI